MKKTGFTLIELLIVIAIAAMLVAIAMPAISLMCGFGPQPKNIAEIEEVKLDSGRIYLSILKEVKIALFHDLVTNKEINVSVKGAPKGELLTDEDDKYWYVFIPTERKTYQAVFKAMTGSSVAQEIQVEIEVN